MAQSVEIPEICPFPSLCTDARSGLDPLSFIPEVLYETSISYLKVYGENTPDAVLCEYFNPGICPVREYMTKVKQALLVVKMISSTEEDDS